MERRLNPNSVPLYSEFGVVRQTGCLSVKSALIKRALNLIQRLRLEFPCACAGI